MRFAIAASLLLVSCPLNAQDARFRDLFDLETVETTQLSAIAVAVDLAAITAESERPNALELANWLKEISKQGLVELPDWIDKRKHLVPVAISAEVPDGGARQGRTVPCQVVSFEGKSLDGMIVPKTELKAANDSYAVASGRIADKGLLVSGAQLQVDCHPQLTIEIDGHLWLSFRLNKSRGWGTDSEVVADAIDRIRTDYSSHYQVKALKGYQFAKSAGHQRMLLRVPSAYENDLLAFVFEIGEMILAVPTDRPRANTPTNPHMQAREEIEASYKKRIVDGLSYIPACKISVSADLRIVEGSSPTSYEPEELRVSIAIPRSYVSQLARQQIGDDFNNTDLRYLEKHLKTGVERWVQNILPRLSLGEDEYRQLEIIFYDPPSGTVNWPESVRN